MLQFLFISILSIVSARRGFEPYSGRYGFFTGVVTVLHEQGEEGCVMCERFQPYP